MSEIEIYIQEQRENDEILQELQNQRKEEDLQQSDSKMDTLKVHSFLQKMNLKSIPNSGMHSAKNKSQQNISINKSKSQDQLQFSTLQSFTPIPSNESKRVKASFALQQSQDIQTSFFQPGALIEDLSEYELCKNVLKKPKTERNDKDLSVLQITLGNNLELLQKYKTFLPMKNFKELLYHFEYTECSPFEQILNIESKSNRIYILLKGDLGIFIPRIEDNEQDDLTAKGRQNKDPENVQQSQQQPMKLQIRKSQTQQTLGVQQDQLNQKEVQKETQIKELEKRNSTSKQLSEKTIKTNPQSMCNIPLLEEESSNGQETQRIKSNFKKDMEEKFKNFKLLKFAKVGEMYGETSLEYRNQEIFSVVCASHCEFAVVEAAAFYNCFAHKFFLLHLECEKMLRKTQLFYNWPHYSLYEFSKIAQRHVFNIHDVVFNIGDRINRIYFFCSGIIHKLEPLAIPSDAPKLNIKQKSGGSAIQQQTGTKIEVINSACVFGEEGIIDHNDETIIKKRKYQVLSKRDDTIIYSIDRDQFKSIYDYIIAKEGLDSYEQQQEKKKRKFLDSIYRSIRQMERIQILEKTIDDIKRQRMKDSKRKNLSRQQILNENQMLYAITNDDLDHMQLNQYLKNELGDKRGDSNGLAINKAIAPKKRSLSQMNSRQNQALYNVTNFHFTEKELKRFKEIQMNKIDQTLNQEKNQQSINIDGNGNQVMIVKNDLITQPQMHHNNQEHANFQQQQVLHSSHNQFPSKKLEQIKYNVIVQHMSQYQQFKPPPPQNSKNPSILMGSKKQKFQNSDKFSIQKYSQQNPEKKQNKLNVNSDLLINDQEQQVVQGKVLEFEHGEQKEIQTNELNKVEQQTLNPQQTSRMFKVNYNHYKNIIHNVNKSQKINNFYDGSQNEVDLFKNTSFFFEKNENNQNNTASAQKMRNFSSDRKDNPGSPQNASILLKKTPFQKYKDSADEVKKIIKIRRSQSEKRYDFQIKTKQFDIPNLNQFQVQYLQPQQQSQIQNISQSINTNNMSISGEQAHKANMAVLSNIINYKLNSSGTNMQLTSDQNSSNNLTIQQQLEQSIDNIYRKSSSPVPNYKHKKTYSMPQTLEEFHQKKILNSPKLHQIDLTMNAQSINKVFKNTLKLKSWQNTKNKSKITQNQGNQTDLKYPQFQAPPINQQGPDQMRSLATHIQNFEFYARCKNENNPYNVFDGESSIIQDFISRPQTAAAVQNIVSRKTLIKDLMKQTSIKSYKIVPQQDHINNN